MGKLKEIVVEAEPRTETGKNACRRLRAQGKVPCNVYGLNQDPMMVAVSPKRIEEVLRLESGHNTIITLSLAGDGQSTRAAMIRELQRDPVTENMVHLDFVRVDLTRAVHVSVPVRLLGQPEGVKNEGGLLDFVHRQVQVECLPGNIPEHLDVDVSALHLNQHVSVSDLHAGEGVRILDAPESIVAVVVPPKAEETAAATPEEAEAASKEPELIKKGKETEPGAEASAKDKPQAKEKSPAKEK
jgi:large subunit ribosomal protein L25